MGRKSRISENTGLSPSSSFRKQLRRKNEDTNSSTTSGKSSLTLKGSIKLDSVSANIKLNEETGENSTSWIDFSIKNTIKTYLFSQPRTLALLFGGVLLAVGYFLIISAHFHSLTNFSSLSNLEKELSLPTQTAFRYSFFKKVATQPSFITGIRAVIYDNNTNYPTTTNSFQKYSLAPEVMIAGGFHVLKTFEKIFHLSLEKCWKGSGTGGWESWRCSGLSDPLTFYLNANWAFDSLFVALLYGSGFLLSKSVIGGVLTCLTFVLNHPQLSDWEKMFPDGDKVGSYLSYCQICLLPYLLFTKSHPSWTPVVKMGVLVGFLIIAWPMESQWILASQLLISVLLLSTNMLSPFLISIIIAAHLTGWEYASLMTLDPSLVNWTFYGYLFLASITLAFVLRPIVDGLLGGKLDKWMFLRCTILLLGFHIILTTIGRELPPLLSLNEHNEDPRLSSYMGAYGGGPDALNKTRRSRFGFGVEVEGALEGKYYKDKAFSESESALSRWLNAIHKEEDFHGEERASSEESLEIISMSSQDNPSAFFKEQQSDQPSSTGDENTIYDSNLPIKSDEVFLSNTKNTQSEEEGEDDETYFTIEEKSQLEEISTKKEMKLAEERKLNRFLIHCLLSNVKYPISQFIYQNSFLCGLFLLSLLSQVTFMIREWKRKDARARISRQVACYHFLHTFPLLAITFTIHNKFQIMALAQLSLAISFLVDHQKFWWCYERFNLSLGKRAHSLILVVIVSVMISTAKLRLDRLYQLPQTQERVEGDSEGIGELLEATNWIRKHSESGESFIGPGALMVNVYLSGERPCMNHLEDTLPHWRKEESISDQLYGLFSREKSIEEFHNELVNSNSRNVTYLFLSHKFCSFATFPFTSEALKEKILSDSQVNKKIEKTGLVVDQLPLHENRRRNPRTHNKGFLSSAWQQQYAPFSPPNKQCCDMKKFWDEQIEKGSGEEDVSAEGETLCHRLLSGNPLTIKPFGISFSNRMFTILKATI